MTSAGPRWTRATAGHFIRHYLEMVAAMFVPFIVLFIPLWLGLISAGLIILGHVLMLVGMAMPMLLRPAEYAGHHPGQGI